MQSHDNVYVRRTPHNEAELIDRAMWEWLMQTELLCGSDELWSYWFSFPKNNPYHKDFNGDWEAVEQLYAAHN